MAKVIQTPSADHCGAMLAKNGAQVRSKSGVRHVGTPPATGTVNTRIFRPASWRERCPRKAIVRPSGAKTGALTGPAVSVRQHGTPPVAGTSHTSVALS